MLYNGNTMSKRQVIMILGVWVAIFMFLGFPSSADRLFAIISGLLILGIAYRMPAAAKNVAKGQVPFVEHKSENSSQNPLPVNDIKSPTNP
jgi:hypothetical protein